MITGYFSVDTISDHVGKMVVVGVMKAYMCTITGISKTNL